MALILSGIIVGAIFSALVSIMKYLAADTELREITFWMMGGFYYATWDDVFTNAAAVLPCVALISLTGWKLNLLSLGDEGSPAPWDCIPTGRGCSFWLWPLWPPPYAFPPLASWHG